MRVINLGPDGKAIVASNDRERPRDRGPLYTQQKHMWVPSPLGHGDQWCSHCLMTMREASVLGELEECKPANP